MAMKRPPIPELRPFVAVVWSEETPVCKAYDQPIREHALPTGAMHLVFRLTDAPLRILIEDADHVDAQTIAESMVGGARSRFYVRELSAPSCSVGAVLRPGAAELLFGASAEELAERHTPLGELWGASAHALRNRLLDTDGPEARLKALEGELAARLPRLRCLHPAIASVIDEMPSLRSVEIAVQRSGLSHRHFIAQFRRTVGLPPKVYLRILRFQKALRSLHHDGTGGGLAALAADAGYSDQAHFNRDFLEFTGITPAAYAARSPRQSNHLPVADIT
jgi:AraC-like DNA-binding protein